MKFSSRPKAELMHIDTERMTDTQKVAVVSYLTRERSRIKNDVFQEAMDRGDVVAAVNAIIRLTETSPMRDPDTGTLVMPEQQRSLDLDQVIAQVMLVHVIHTLQTTD